MDKNSLLTQTMRSDLKGVTIIQSATDGHLIKEFQRGNQDAFVELHSRYSRLVFSLAYRMLRHGSVDDAVQDVFIALWNKSNLYQPQKGSFHSWFMTLAHNHIADRLRRNKNRNHQSLESVLRIDELSSQIPSMDEQIRLEAISMRVSDAMSSLPDAQEEVLQLAYFENMSHSKISLHLNIPLGTVKKRVRLGLDKLRRKLIDTEVIES